MNLMVDTTVLLYAVGTEHVLREPCRRLLIAHGRGQVELITTVDVVLQFVHVRARRRDRHDAATLGWHYAHALEVVEQEPPDLDLGLTLFDLHPKLAVSTAMLAAVALNREVDALVSADRAFVAIPNLVCLHPTDETFARLLDGHLG